MFKRMLRAVLVTALSAGIGLGAVSAMDLAWSHPAKSTAAPSDLAWITPAGDKA
ncbi:hypothetical protein AB0I84_41615 [Streptomyces spectabilis]|nr:MULTISPECIES: hypothetical protein [Streptomyces]MBB5103726.1 hypothetical protein [Streptomyces spectabilis]MCI3904032.1 hypothetical protein [Streptomyces spectabilis]MCI3931999.1 hypothetical protein [Streptomyces sp. AN091965]GGV19161.1 hypothetical protein GCM10010245_32390 [Streptomyces spectabilis]